MSEGAAEGGAPLSEGQFGDGLTETTDLPGETAQNPGDGIFSQGFYPWYIAQNATFYGARSGRISRPKKRKKQDE